MEKDIEYLFISYEGNEKAYLDCLFAMEDVETQVEFLSLNKQTQEDVKETILELHRIYEAKIMIDYLDNFDNFMGNKDYDIQLLENSYY